MRRHVVVRIALGVFLAVALLGGLAAPASAGGRGLTRVDVYSLSTHELTVLGNGAVAGRGDASGNVGHVFGAVDFYDGTVYLGSVNTGSGGIYVPTKTAQLLTYTWSVPSAATRAVATVHFGMYSKSNPTIEYTYRVAVDVTLVFPTGNALLLGSSSTRLAV